MSGGTPRAARGPAITAPAALGDGGELLHVLPGGARVWFTTRAEGNLSSVGGDGHEQGADARAQVLARTGAHSLARGYQVHGTVVRRVLTAPAPPEQRPDPQDPADGHATALPATALLILAADCIPVAIASGDAVAIVHAGWRGLAAGVLQEGLDAVRELGERDASVAVIGPCAGACCYEVGPEVHAALGLEPAARGRIDLRALARERLRAAGVAEIRDEEACTICDERFFSHRREGPRAGRQGAIAWITGAGGEVPGWSS